MTCDTRHVTGDMWQVEEGEHCLKISAPLLYWLGNEGLLNILSMSNEGAFRTAPATPGLLNILH